MRCLANNQRSFRIQAIGSSIGGCDSTLKPSIFYPTLNHARMLLTLAIIYLGRT
ncbi:hypothetical protein BDV23DRAFT_156431 [Aspergillus alliaceus]|uniref:Uncharacterized protein n=1 Tax=Petromyces alliaceus TaxID=209559 RepID=A0A5N7C760_PETAA|nr:hypothetical protein BDV23DRAFT_156431 [Aspergillus alliaceus]